MTPKTYTPPQAFEMIPRPPIKLERVTSSQLAAAGYDPESQTLALQFRSKGGLEAPVYCYPDFTAEAYAEFRRADSLGSHFKAKIKARPFKKFKAEPFPPEAGA